MYRVINTTIENETAGPHGLRYVNDASRPFAVLVNQGIREICVRRFATEQAARRWVRTSLSTRGRSYAAQREATLSLLARTFPVSMGRR